MSKKGKKLDYFDVAQINELIKGLEGLEQVAKQSAEAYSSDPTSQSNFEVGYLRGYVKTAASILKDIMK